MKYFLCFFLSVFLLNCKQDKQSLTAVEIINRSIEVSGGEKFDNSEVEFDFRIGSYKAIRGQGKFRLERLLRNEMNDSIVDVLSNNGFERFVNGDKEDVIDSEALRFSASVNSVHYFSVLPYGLNDKAVHKELLGETTIKGKDYHKIQVTFNEDGGGEDFEDVFVYWINTATHKADYLAYSYNENHGKGLRFREAYNERYVNGLRFVDYNNYKPTNPETSLFELDKLYENNALTLLSKIELKNVSVN